MNFAGMTDEELQAKITKYSEAIEQVATGGVGVVAGEGRRMEYTQGNSKLLERLLYRAEEEWYRRHPEDRPTVSGACAISMSFPR